MEHHAREPMGRTIFRYFNSMLLKQLIGVAVAVLRPKFLSPEHFGLFNLLKVIPGYAAYAHLGSRSSTRYAIPRLLAEGRMADVRAIKGAMFHGTFWTNAIFAAVFLVSAWPGAAEPAARAGILTVVLIILITWYNDYVVTLLKGHQRFDLVGRVNYLTAAASFVTLPLVWAFEIYGLFASMVLAAGCITLYLRAAFPEHDCGPGDWREFGRLIRSGFPIMSLGLGMMAIRTVDRFVISGILGNEQLGYYGVGAMIFNLLMQLPSVSREVVEPRLMESLSSRSERENMEAFLARPLLHTAYLMPFLVGGAFFGAPVAVDLLLQRYAPGIPAMQMLMTGAFFFGLTFVTRGIIVARHWQTRSLLPLGLVLAGSVPCSVLAAWIGLGIEGVAAVTSLSLAALLLVLLGFLRRMAGPDVLDWRRLYRLVALPGAVMFALLGGYRLLAGARWLEPWPCIIGGAIYMILAALLAYWAVRRFPELSGLRLLGRGAGREDT